MKLVTEYLEDTVKKFPDKIAFVDENGGVTYTHLRKRALLVADILQKRKIFKEPIVILMDKGTECIAAFLGVAYSGNFYTPIDSRMPVSRIEKIIDTLKPACIIASERCGLVDSDIISNYSVLFYEKMICGDCSDESEILAISKRIIDTDILYVLFTSGSTGIPKGVIISHRSVIDYIEWVVETFNITNEDSFGNQAPFYFDNSILDIYSTLKMGSTMYIIPEKLFTFPIELLEYLQKNAITTIFWVPSAICLVANLKALGKVSLPNLRRVLFCGEPMPNKQLNMWRHVYPEPMYANLYGPTEITDVCTYYIVDRDFLDSDSLPIGHPCNNTDILVLNGDDKLVEGDEIGELCVRGTSLSYGYYNNEKRTAEAFVQNPLNHNYTEMIYRTGDLVKYNEYGELLYISRKDFQIKHMGHRIELGEIETAVNSISQVENCCCLYDEKRKKIVLFYIADNEIEDIKEQLKVMIPDYMLPGRIKKLDKMPMNLNGKVDRSKIKEML